MVLSWQKTSSIFTLISFRAEQVAIFCLNEPSRGWMYRHTGYVKAQWYTDGSIAQITVVLIMECGENIFELQWWTAPNDIKISRLADWIELKASWHFYWPVLTLNLKNTSKFCYPIQCNHNNSDGQKYLPPLSNQVIAIIPDIFLDVIHIALWGRHTA